MELRNRQTNKVSRRPNGRRGFTLIEIMIAVLLLE